MKIHIAIVISFFFVSDIFSQKIWTAQIPYIEKSGYYNIELSQELSGAGLQNIKILDEAQNEIPYFIRSADPIQEIKNFQHFELYNKQTKDSLNIIVVHNNKKENLNRFCIILQKADASKYVLLKGSNDLNQWYIVKQQTEISDYRTEDGGNNEMVIIDFPQGNYRYYEISIWSNQKNPLEVMSVGKIKNSNTYGNFVAIDFGIVTQDNHNSKKTTIINFPEVSHTYCINKVAFFISNKPDFYRKATIYDSISRKKENLILTSRTENIFYLNNFYFTSRTTIEIDNQHNPPLFVDSIKIFGLSRYACVYLEEGKKYTLYLNQEDVIVHPYDIEHFRDEIPVDLPILRLINQQFNIMKEKPEEKRDLSLIEKPIFLWSVILLIGLFLLLLCYKMITDLKKRT